MDCSMRGFEASITGGCCTKALPKILKANLDALFNQLLIAAKKHARFQALVPYSSSRLPSK